MTEVLRSGWGRLFSFGSPFGLALVLLFGIPRFLIVLQANRTGNYSYVSLLFLAMWIAPFILLTGDGRRSIGMKRPVHYSWLFFSLLGGMAVCAVMIGAAELFFGTTTNNWFIYISRSYPAAAIISNPGPEKHVYFLIYALIGITLSPVGEELLYRGIIHGSFATQAGEYKASLFDSLAFALTHVAHIGIIHFFAGWSSLFSGFLWVLFMFGVSRLFFICKEETGSLLGAILCHAGYNLAMTYFIFYHILLK